MLATCGMGRSTAANRDHSREIYCEIDEYFPIIIQIFLNIGIYHLQPHHF